MTVTYLTKWPKSITDHDLNCTELFYFNIASYARSIWFLVFYYSILKVFLFCISYMNLNFSSESVFWHVFWNVTFLWSKSFWSKSFWLSLKWRILFGLIFELKFKIDFSRDQCWVSNTSTAQTHIYHVRILKYSIIVGPIVRGPLDHKDILKSLI